MDDSAATVHTAKSGPRDRINNRPMLYYSEDNLNAKIEESQIEYRGA